MGGQGKVWEVRAEGSKRKKKCLEERGNQGEGWEVGGGGGGGRGVRAEGS